MSEQYKKLIKDIQTYPNMNEHIKKILSFSLGNFEAYTLARIIELEEQVENYKRIANECLERLNTPGIDSKGFIYNKLLEVVNDE